MPRKTTSKSSKAAPKKVAKKSTDTAPEKVSQKKKVKEQIVLESLAGMRDFLPGDQAYWDQVRKVTTRGAQEYGFTRLDTPILEHESIVAAALGEESSIVQNDLYSFTTKGREKVVLRPEFTTSVVRAYVQHGMNVMSKPLKLFSIGPVFRYDTPKNEHYRELHQANFEIMGEDDPILDAQVIQLADRIVQKLGIKNAVFHVNSIGSQKCQKEYKALLKSYLNSKKHKLPANMKDLVEENPFAILDSKDEKCMQIAAGAPQSIDHLDTESRAHFKNLLEYLDEMEIRFEINPTLVRGLNYYTRTVFEIWSGGDEEGRMSLGGGGRYDDLIKKLGGESTPAIGFALGLDRLVSEMKSVHAKSYKDPQPRVFLAQLGALAKKKSLKLFSEVERNGILVAESFGRGNLKTQMRLAERRGVDITLIVGQKEALDGTVIVKDMITGSQETVTQQKVIGILKKKLKK